MDVKKENYNIGLAFIRIWMSFEVVLCHFWKQGKPSIGDPLWIFSKTTGLAVPVFMLMSFILTEKTINYGRKRDIALRFRRLFIPYIAWAIIYWLIYEFTERIFSIDLVNGIGDLGWQLLLGSSSNVTPQLWYQFCLIAITFIFVALFRLMKKDDNKNCILFAIMIVALIVQYSNLNWEFFNEFRYEVKYPLGRMCEMIPYACMGMLIQRYDLLSKVENRRYHAILVSILALYLLMRYEAFSIPDGFGYQGIYGICTAFFIVVFWYVIPFAEMPEYITKIIMGISKYSLGVFCIHLMVGKLLNLLVFPKLNWRINTFKECILIYFLCLIGSCLIAKIPCKFVKSMVI